MTNKQRITYVVEYECKDGVSPPVRGDLFAQDGGQLVSASFFDVNERMFTAEEAEFIKEGVNLRWGWSTREEEEEYGFSLLPLIKKIELFNGGE